MEASHPASNRRPGSAVAWATVHITHPLLLPECSSSAHGMMRCPAAQMSVSSARPPSPVARVITCGQRVELDLIRRALPPWRPRVQPERRSRDADARACEGLSAERPEIRIGELRGRRDAPRKAL